MSKGKITQLKPDKKNANRGTERGRYMVEASLRELGAGRSILVDKDGNVIAGNKTLEAAASLGLDDIITVETTGEQLVVVKRVDLDLSDPTGKARQLAHADNRTSEVSYELDPLVLAADLDAGIDLSSFYFEHELVGILEDAGTELLNLDEPQEPLDSEPKIDKAKELAEKWGVQPGQLWVLPSRDGKGEHRLLCGDSTKEGDIKRVNTSPVTLLHADPPYGMGKEKDGVENDNLYSDKLDTFQLSWLKASLSSLTDNASIYIWGNAEDLWRLWYKKILVDFPRVTFRNELVWDKKHGQGMGSESHRMYPTASERCLFFMLGEQGFNNNADNYWEGWDSVRLYLESQKKLMGWNNKTIADFFGFHPRMADHWFSNSQWSFPLEEQYRTMQREAKGKAFKKEYDELKKEYDELKKEFYSTRAYFDNTHQNMTDVFFYERVTGEERHNHATPKPTAMIQMLIKSSCPVGELVFEPFLGSGTTLIACENTGRYCRAIEISPGYVAVALQRYLDNFGITAELEGEPVIQG